MMFRDRIVITVFSTVWLVLVVKLYYFSIKSNSYYDELSNRNSLKTEIVFPSRGVIFDRNHKPLAVNKLGFTIKLPAHLSNKKKEPILDAKIKMLIGYFPSQTFEKLKNNYLKVDSPYNHEPIRVIDFIPYEMILPFYAKLNIDDTISVEPTDMRDYPEKNIGSHIIGYVGKISQDDLNNKELLQWTNGYTGKEGLEKQYNSELQGEPGFRTYKVDAFNRQVEEVANKDPSKLNFVVTSIDVELQKLISQLFTDKAGAIVVMDLRDGGILAAGSYPEFDINAFARGLEQSEWDALVTDVNHPLSNRLIKGLYPPGSTIKPGVAFSFLKAGINEHDSIADAGFVEFGGRKFRDWKKEGHGIVDMRKAIKESCDVYFYTFSTRAGIDIISNTLDRFGIGKKTGIDLPGEFSGINPSRDWKRKRYGKGWYAGDTLITAIGQGSMLATPIQIAKYTAVIATGKDITPKFAMKIGNNDVPSKITNVLTPEEMTQMQIVRDGMYLVCNSPGGTGTGALGDLKVKVAGKTGTAQVSSISQSEVNRLKETQLEYLQRSHAWLTTYAPYDNPQYVITALVEHGGHGGSEAGPMVAEVYKKMIELGYLKPTPKDTKPPLLH
jgi:penicillin-binding protein 2